MQNSWNRPSNYLHKVYSPNHLNIYSLSHHLTFVPISTTYKSAPKSSLQQLDVPTIKRPTKNKIDRENNLSHYLQCIVKSMAHVKTDSKKNVSIFENTHFEKKTLKSTNKTHRSKIKHNTHHIHRCARCSICPMSCQKTTKKSENIQKKNRKNLKPHHKLF
jgi:hypothetical protein